MAAFLLRCPWVVGHSRHLKAFIVTIAGEQTLDANLTTEAGAHAVFGWGDANQSSYDLTALFSGGDALRLGPRDRHALTVQALGRLGARLGPGSLFRWIAN